MNTNTNYLFLALSILLFLMGRLCDDLGWYAWSGLSGNGFVGIALGTLAGCAIFTIVRKSNEEGGIRTLLQSQLRFATPWCLIILLIILVFNSFGCQVTVPSTTSFFEIEYTGCCLYSVVLVLTNLNYSLSCNTKSDLPLLIVQEVVLFAEIVYNGTLVASFVADLDQKAKYSYVLFIAVIIVWEVLVMELLFRKAYEDRINEAKQKEIQQLVAGGKKIQDYPQSSNELKI